MNELERQVRERLISGEPLEGLGLDRVDGRWDLRRMKLSGEPPFIVDGKVLSYARTHIKGVTIESVDLRGAHWEALRLSDVVLSNSLFDRAKLAGLHADRTTVADCSFKGTSLQNSLMTSYSSYFRPISKTSWTRVDFSYADLRDSIHSNEIYADCDFSRAKLDGVEFDGSRHVRSLFSGKMEEVNFRQVPQSQPGFSFLRRHVFNEMVEVDFSNATLVLCGFNELGLENVKLPDEKTHVIYSPKVAVSERVLKLLPADSSLYDFMLEILMETAIEEGPVVGGYGIETIKSLGDTDETRLFGLNLIRQAEAEVQAEIAKGHS